MPRLPALDEEMDDQTPKDVVQKPAKKPYKCPVVYPGELVWYWRDCNTDGIPGVAIVTSVNTSGDGNITGTAVSRGGVYLAPIESTMFYKDDPRLKDNPELARGGIWDVCPRISALTSLIREVSELTERVAALEGR